MLATLLRFRDETARKKLDDVDMGLGYMRVIFKKNGWAHVPPGHSHLSAGKLMIVWGYEMKQPVLKLNAGIAETTEDAVDSGRHITIQLD